MKASTTNLIRLLSCILFCSCALVAAHTASESLRLEKLGNSGKTAGIFTSKYSHAVDVFSMIRDEYIFPSALLDNLYRSGARDFEVQAGCGSFNQALLDKFPLKTELNFPRNGVQLQVFGENKDIEWTAAVSTISEMVMLSSKRLKSGNTFSVNNTQTKSFIYAQDPTDFVCSDNIQKLKKYLPCAGEKGVFDLIDQTLLFRADFIGISVGFHMTNTEVNVIIQISTVFSTSEKDTLFKSNVNIEACPIVQSAAIQSGDILEEPGFLDSKNKLKVFKKLNAIQVSLPSQIQEIPKNLLATQRSMTSSWNSRTDSLVHAFENTSSETLIVESFEYLQYHFYPIFSEIQILINGVDILKQNLSNSASNKATVTYSRDNLESVLFRVKIQLLPNQKATLVIPVYKMMKPFEEYPHDPFRGFDIIAAPVVYHIQGQNKNQSQVQFSDNVISFLIVPDFTMPFNIITYTSVLFGYLFLQIFRISTEKLELGQQDDNILKKILNLFKN